MLDKRLVSVIVKLGGSVITDKNKIFTPKIDVIDRLAKEISESKLKSIILIHGGGSFGHPIASKYKIFEGYKNNSQLIGFSKTKQAMQNLNKIVIASLIKYGLPVVNISPSSCILSKKGRIYKFNYFFIKKFLKLGFIPVLHGDCVLDVDLGMSIVSGDQLAAKLALYFNSKKIFFALNIDGLFYTNPEVNKNAVLIEEFSLSDLRIFLSRIGEADSLDVTRGMYGKMFEIIPALERGIQIRLFNGKVENNLYKLLKDENVKGTKIKPW